MATTNAAGELQLEQQDILPQKVAYRTDDPAHIRAKIDELNADISTAEDLATALEQIDALRRQWRASQNLPPLPSEQ